MEEYMKKLEKEITCGLCLEYYKDARVLPCFHYYCEECISNKALKYRNEHKFFCPKCSKDVKNLESKKNELCSALFVDRKKLFFVRMIRALSSQISDEKTRTKVEVLSKQWCSGILANKENADIGDQGVLTFQDFYKDVMNASQLLSFNCHIHLKNYNRICVDCSKLMCLDCISDCHNNHTIEYFDAADRITENQFKNTLKCFTNLRNSLSITLDVITNTEGQVKAQETSVIQTIENSFDNLYCVLETHKQQMLKEKNNSNPEMEQDMMVEMNYSDTLQELCQDRAKIIYPADCLVVDIKDSIVEVNKESEILVSVKKSLNCNLNFQCYLKSFVNGETVRATIESENPDEYYIVFTPTVRGRHKLFLFVNGLPAVSSPFAVFVSSLHALPKQPETPVAYGQVCPNSLAMTSKGELVAVECEGDIVILSKQETKRVTYDKSKHGMGDLISLAIDSSNVVYLIDDFTNQVGKMSMASGHFEHFQVEQINGPGHICIAVSRDEVMVTEHKNVNKIIVYYKNFVYKRCITGSGGSSVVLRCFSLDSQGNIYVSDSNMNIQILSSLGILLGQFKCSETAKPWTIQVFNQHVYVSDCINECTVIYTTGGKAVTSIKCCGATCVDMDGFVYIFDFLRRLLFCF